MVSVNQSGYNYVGGRSQNNINNNNVGSNVFPYANMNNNIGANHGTN